MAVEVWWRNPEYYIREVIEIQAPKLAWDRGYLIKRSLDPMRFANLHFPHTIEYKALVVGHQGTAEIDRSHGMDNPLAVYPTWHYAVDDFGLLEEMLENPAGISDACGDMSLPLDERPVWGQEHRVVILDIPELTTGIGRRFIRDLSKLQEEYPEATIHLHALYSFRVMFGMNFCSVDLDPKTEARKGRVFMPHGKKMTYEQAQAQPQWVRAVGFSVGDLLEARQRCMFNMKSALWAAQYWKKEFNFRANGKNEFDPHSESFTPATTGTSMSRQLPVMTGDKIVCDLCSLQVACKHFREGSVCTLPQSEVKGLAGLFGSRNADEIIDGLSAILSKQGERAERAIELEEAIGDVDPEVTKLLNGVFANGVKLAKLINPKLSQGVQVNLNMPGPAPQRLMAGAIKQLEDQGYTREEMTPELVARVLGVTTGDLELEAGTTQDAEVVSDA